MARIDFVALQQRLARGALASALVVDFPDELRWPSDRQAKVELRRFTLSPRGPDDRGEITVGRAAGQSRRW